MALATIRLASHGFKEDTIEFMGLAPWNSLLLTELLSLSVLIGESV